jgi:pteridine reductase
VETEARHRRTYLITGAAERIGRALALGLAPQASAIVVHYHFSAAAAQELVGELIGRGTKAFAVSADLSSAEEAAGLLDLAWELAGPIDVLLNNASIFEPGRLPDVSADDLHRNMMVNAFAPLLLSRCFAARNRDRTAALSPAIVNLLDTRIASYDREHAAYHLSKRMLLALTEMMALEFSPRIRVNAVAPGLILPPHGKDQAYLEQMKSTNPLNRVGSVEQIVEAVRFLVESEYVTGQVIYVDGGRHLLGNTYGGRT